MLNKIILFSLKNKLLVGLLILGLIGYGAYEVTKLPIDAVPDITDNQVQIITSSPSLGAPDIERLITFPLEQATSNIPGLKEIRSFSRFGLSLITIVFEDDVDVYWARQQVSERIKTAQNQIPTDLGTPELAPVTTGLGEIYQYVLKPKKGFESKFDATELRTTQDWLVRRQLLNVKGVADVSSFGGNVKQFEIAINPAVLNSYGITISDVFTALENNNENAGGGYIERESTVLYIRTEGLISSLNDIRSIAVKNLEDGTPLLIGDVAEVKIGKAIRYGAMTYNDEGEVAGAVVMMLKGANSSEVIDNVKNKIEQIKKNLPEGVELVPFLDRSKMVDSAIGTVTKNLIEGALIVVFILILFLGNWRAGLIVASVIPLAMLFAIILMNTFGVSGNLMSLGALDFGLIVDGSVIIVEACMFQLHFSKLKKVSQIQMDEIVYETSTRMRNAAIFGEIIILVVYLPIFTLQGIEGKMFIPMAQTVAFALFGAFILSLTYIPVMSSLFLKKSVSHKANFSDKMMAVLENIQQKYLKKVLHYPKLLISITLVLFVFAFITFRGMGGEFIPELPEGDFAVETRVLTGSNLETSTDAILKSAEILMKKFPEIEQVVGKTGSGEIPTDPMPMEASDMMIILKDKSEWVSAESWDELSAKMSKELEAVPGVTYSFQYPVAMRFNELMTGAKQDVVCKIYGENLDTLSKYSKIVGKIVSSIKGTKNVYVEPIDGLPQLIIKYNRNLISEFGLQIKEVNKVVNAAFAGQTSGLVFEDEKRFDMVVRLAGENRENLNDVNNLLIPCSNGTQIPLSQIAEVKIEESVNQIQREDAKRRIIVGFNVGDRDVESIVLDLQKELDEKLKLPSGYYTSFGGAFENLEAAKARLSLAVPISLVLIFVLLYFAFKSLKHALLIYSAIPLSTIGGVFFLAFRGMPFSISAGIGFIALFGVAVLNGIVLVAEYNRIRKEENDILKVVLQGTKHRLRPVLMTAFVASLGFLPMALSNGAGADVQRPLATVVIGGLLVSTFLTLFILPVLYIMFEKINLKKMKTKSKAIAISVAFFLLMPNLNAQTSISLPAAIDSALVNNLKVKNQKLQIEYQEKLKATAINIQSTEFSVEYGQINSFFNDSKFGISQRVDFPTVYKRQKALLTEHQKVSEINFVLQEAILKREVSDIYGSILFLMDKQNVLMEVDSIYSTMLEKITLGFRLGENNELEKTTAEIQLGQISIQINELKNDLELALMRFNLLLNSNGSFIPLEEKILLGNNTLDDSKKLESHPELSFYEEQISLAKASSQVEKSSLLPSLLFAYSNQSMRGTGADDVLYTSAKRFNAVQVGLSIPLFYGAQKAKISASKTLELVAENTYQQEFLRLKNEFDSAKKNYELQLNKVSYFEKTAVPKSELIANLASQKLSNGEISFFEWALLFNNVTTVKSNYVEAKKELNTAIVRLNYLLNK